VDRGIWSFGDSPANHGMRRGILGVMDNGCGMKIFICRDYEDFEIVFADTIEEVRNQISARYEIAEITLPPGMFLGQWHKVSECKPDDEKEVYIRFPVNRYSDVKQYEYHIGWLHDWISKGEQWSIRGNLARMDDTDEWTEIPQ
jgi:hypothetical protein